MREGGREGRGGRGRGREGGKEKEGGGGRGRGRGEGGGREGGTGREGGKEEGGGREGGCVSGYNTQFVPLSLSDLIQMSSPPLPFRFEVKGLQEGCPEMTLQQFIDHFKVYTGRRGKGKGGRQAVQCTTML